MKSDIELLSWLVLTKRVLLTPHVFFAQLPGEISFRTCMLYIVKTAFIVSLLNTLFLSLAFYVIVSSFTSILTAFIAIFGILLTPFIAVLGNMPPEKVPEIVGNFAKSGELQIGIFSAKLGGFLFVSYFCAIMASTYIQASLAHIISRLLGSTGSFRTTAAAYTFGSAAWMLSLIPVINLIAPLYGAILNIIAMRQVHRLAKLKAIFVVAIAATIPVIGYICYSSLLN